MFAVRLVDGTAVQCVVSDAPPTGWIASADRIALGSTWDGETFTPPPGPTDAERLAAWRESREISRLELAFALREATILTQAEAQAFAAYQIPAPLTALLSTLPTETQADVSLTFTGARDFPRAHPAWDALAQAEGWPEDADIDAVFGWGG